MSEQWTPKADDFRQVWAAFNGYGGLVDRPSSVSMDEGYAEFDRWLEQERAAARREGQADAWDEAHADGCEYVVDRACREFHPNPYRNGVDR